MRRQPENIQQQLEQDEGRSKTVYKDSEDYDTIGIGCLVDKRKPGAGLPDPVIDFLFQFQLREKQNELDKKLSWARTLDDARYGTLTNIAFQLGVDGLLKFQKALKAMREGNWTLAAVHFADSLVAREQTPDRWKRHCDQIRTGEWQ